MMKKDFHVLFGGYEILEADTKVLFKYGGEAVIELEPFEAFAIGLALNSAASMCFNRERELEKQKKGESI